MNLSEGDEQKAEDIRVRLFGVPIVFDNGDGLTDDERQKINNALKSGEAQKLARGSAIHLDAIDTDSKTVGY